MLSVQVGSIEIQHAQVDDEQDSYKSLLRAWKLTSVESSVRAQLDLIKAKFDSNDIMMVDCAA